MNINFRSEWLFVFDIETIADEEVAFNLIGEKFDTLVEKREALTQYHLDITDGRNAFLRQPFHKIVALSYLLAKITYSGDGESYELRFLKSAGTIDSSEEDIVRGFFNIVDKYKPKIVSFNGKGFDIPVIKYRAMKYGIQGNFFHTTETKWEGYNKRYTTEWHCDLIDVFSDFGASARIKLNEVCAIMGFPGKFGVDGSKVETMYDDGMLKQIRDYCETDVLNTYLAYLRYMQHVCRITTENYNYSITSVKEFLKNSSQEHFKEFYEQWKISCDNKFVL